MIYSREDYGDLTHPIDEFRSVINSVSAAVFRSRRSRGLAPGWQSKGEDIHYRRNTNAADITGTVQFSPDPGFKALNASVPFSEESLGRQLEKIVVRSETPLSSGPEFARLMVFRLDGEN